LTPISVGSGISQVITKFCLEVPEFLCSEIQASSTCSCPALELLAASFLRIACSRLTATQKEVLLSAESILRFHELTVTRLADEVSRRTGIPYSTVKWNLRSLAHLGLITGGNSSQKGIRAELTLPALMLVEHLRSE